MDGFINFFKPAGITSAKALYRVRKLCGERKSGHTGTLDPAAEGVLVICLGKATKLVEAVMNQPKVYRAWARLDVTSASFDADCPLEPVPVTAPPERTAVEQALAAQEGEIEQIPPAYSALKVGGVPAYKLARRKATPNLAPRRVVIYWAVLHAYAWPEIEFEMACGRGTYVRSVIRDLGARLGVGGCLTRLRRVAVGPFHSDAAWTLEQMATSPPERYILPLGETKALLERQPGWVPPKPTP